MSARACHDRFVLARIFRYLRSCRWNRTHSDQTKDRVLPLDCYVLPHSDWACSANAWSKPEPTLNWARITQTFGYHIEVWVSRFTWQTCTCIMFLMRGSYHQAPRRVVENHALHNKVVVVSHRCGIRTVGHHAEHWNIKLYMTFLVFALYCLCELQNAPKSETFGKRQAYVAFVIRVWRSMCQMNRMWSYVCDHTLGLRVE